MSYNRFFIGIDNGVSGSMAIIGTGPTVPTAVYAVTMPTITQQNYTKKKSNITRIDGKKLFYMLDRSIPKGSEVHILIERPMVNPTRFQATMSAIRALEAVIIVIETLGFSYSYIDSKEWQKQLLPSGTKGDDLKSASLYIAERLYPGKNPVNHKDADGILIAHYCMLKNK